MLSYVRRWGGSPCRERRQGRDRVSVRWIVVPAFLLGVSACSGSKPAAQASPVAPASPTEADLQKPLPNPLPEIAARVNGQALQMRLVGAQAKAVAEHQHDLTPEKVAALYRRALLRLIDRELLFQEALARGLQADDKQIEEAYNRARLKYREDAAWNDFLARQGLDDAAFRTEQRVRSTTDALIHQVTARVPETITDADARATYQANLDWFATGPRYRAAHILVKAPKDMAPTVRVVQQRKANETFERLRSGTDFARLAREVSDDTATASKGGELPEFAGAQLEEPLAQVLSQMRPGEISSVVQSSAGFHIFKLFETLPSATVSFDDYTEKIKEQIVQRRKQDAVAQLLASLKSKARIESFL
jgi:parvulin-like peptidyl-prolyl isomerase